MGKESNNLILFVKPRLARVKNQPNTVVLVMLEMHVKEKPDALSRVLFRPRCQKNDLFNTQMTYHK